MIALGIPTPSGTCFAAYHAAPGPALLICPPFGDPAQVALRPWRALARRLAELGIATLAPDLPGSGDAAGLPGAAPLVATWRDALAACHAWLAARHGGRVSVLGLRLGALFALDLVGGGAGADRLLLLDPPASGAAAARALAAQARLEARGPAPEGPEFLQVLGGLVAPQDLIDLKALPEMAARIACPTLLVGAPPALAAGFTASPVTTLPFDGHEAFVQRDSLSVAAPEAVFDAIAAFLADAPRPAIPAVVPPADLADLPEEVLRFGPEGGLFGLYCRPGADRPPGEVAVLLPTIGAHPRCGLMRCWTELARRLAEAGIPSLRFDSRGVGDSAGEIAEDRLVASYRPDRSAEIAAAIDALAARGIARVVVVGHCSGAYAAWHAAAADPRIAGLVVANPQFLVRLADPTVEGILMPPGAPAASPGTPAAARPGTLRRLRRVVEHWIVVGVRRHAPALGGLLRQNGPAERAARATLRTILRRGCAVEIVISAGDRAHLRLKEAFGAEPRLPAGARLTVIPGADHNFSARQHRVVFFDRAVELAVRIAAPAPRRHPSPTRPTLELAA